MKKKRIYLDTSAISFYYAEDSPEKMAITRKFFEQATVSGKYELCLSALTIRELGGCTDPELRAKLLKFAYELPVEILESTEEITLTGQQLVDDGVIPEKYQDDGFHLAFALLNGIDYIASWNFKHIVKPKTKTAVRAFAIKEGYKLLEIITPEEVAENGDES